MNQHAPIRRVRGRPKAAAPSAWERARSAVDRFVHHVAVEIAVIALIVLSVASMVAEYVYADNATLVGAFTVAGDVITAVFVVELTLKFWVARSKRRFFGRYWIDILAVIPAIRPLRVFRVLRLLRLIRGGTLIKRRMSGHGNVLGGAVNELTTVLALTLTLVLGAAMVLNTYEAGNPDFGEFDAAIWFSVLSLVGGEPIGGDPQTNVGRWTTLLLMMGGLTVFGVFVGAVSAKMVSRLSSGLGVQEMALDELRGHVVVCGWNGSAPTVLLELLGPWSSQHTPVVIITEGEIPAADVPEDRIRVDLLYKVQGDYTRVEVLEQVGIRHASTAVLLTDTVIPRSDQDRDARTVLAALTVERLAPEIFTVAELTNRENESLLKLAGVEEIVVGDWYAGVILGSASRNPGLISVLDEVLSTERGNAFHTAVVPKSVAGTPVAELHQRLFVGHHATLVALERDGAVRVNPPATERVEEGDRLVVLARGPILW